MKNGRNEQRELVSLADQLFDHYFVQFNSITINSIINTTNVNIARGVLVKIKFVTIITMMKNRTFVLISRTLVDWGSISNRSA